MRLAASRSLSLLALFALVSACAPMRPQTVPDEAVDWARHRTAVAGIQDWTAEGRVAIELAEDGFTGSMTWDQLGPGLDFRVRGPFGLGGFRVHGDHQRLWVLTSRGEEYLLTDPAADMQAALGWHLPVRALGHWIRGIPDPAAVASLRVGERGLLRSLEQQGWQVVLADYRTMEEGPSLPHSVEMTGEGVTLRFRIDTWQLGDRVPARAGP